MTDLFLLGFFGLFLVFGLKRPFLWVCAYLYVDILAPQKIGFGVITGVPVSLVAFVAAFGGWLLMDKKVRPTFTFRQVLMLFLLVWAWFTMQGAEFPYEAASKWDWVWKTLLFAMFLPFTVTNRLRFEAAALVMVLTAGAIIISGGLKTVFGGGGYGTLSLFVNDNSGIYESSTISTVAIAIIPLLYWFTRYGTVFPPSLPVKLFAAGLAGACLLIPIGTEARTGLVCIAMLGLLVLRESRHKLLLMVGGVLLCIAAFPFLPQSYADRMATMMTAQEDESASTRVAVWEWTLDYAKAHPLGGGFEAYRANSFTYRMPQTTGEGNMTSTRFEKVTDEGRAYHSAFFEMLGEQGWPGLGAWVLLQALGLYQMERLRRRMRNRGDPQLAWLGHLAIALQYAQLIYLVGALFQGIAWQPFIMMLAGLQIALVVYAKRYDSPHGATIGERLAAERAAAAASARPDAVATGPAPLR
ncbi:MAG: putative O-glycosylation ligase, exosortase A system-associated [Erythrobacter sp.]|nr:putative O-glycosylation ligase, exosortase A system-associated [Erythrobacter sp.]NCQ62498.1 putative O-glycosylation ligase, exosortase A system-associated [Alphaproteobacteria bacterium]